MPRCRVSACLVWIGGRSMDESYGKLSMTWRDANGQKAWQREHTHTTQPGPRPIAPSAHKPHTHTPSFRLVSPPIRPTPQPRREFIGSKLVAFARAHEHVTVKTELKRNAHPFVRAEYGALRVFVHVARTQHACQRLS